MLWKNEREYKDMNIHCDDSETGNENTSKFDNDSFK